ncbi:hypothetical protein GQ53DRAFT_317725 [Thozetella sp. PMI_491]|nr:hypothetical protein GQ53DRAFT_317725 [Thozetella sp. PMI_491]
MANAPSQSSEYTYRVRPASSTSAISQQVEPSPAYLLEWDSGGCRRISLTTTDELRAALSAGKPAGQGIGAVKERLFVLHGLPADFVLAIRNALDIDPAFIEAHAGRRRYRPLRWRKEARFVSYEYPELVRGYEGNSRRHGREQTTVKSQVGIVESEGSDIGSGRARTREAVDLLGNPAIKLLEDEGGIAAIFCHASLWVADQADVLFLDRPSWRDPASPLRKARRQSSVMKPYTVQRGSSISEQSSHAVEIKLADGDEIMSLEDMLQETLKDALDIGEGLMDIISELVYDHWLELLGSLTPQAQRTSNDAVAFYWHALQSLEQNADVVAYLSRSGRSLATKQSDWVALLSRIQTRINLLPLVPRTLPISLSTATSKTGAGTTAAASSKKISRRATFNSGSIKGSQRGSLNSADANQRALDRIAYLGGILLPLPIVSGILSMGDTFGPEGSLFYVFWAASLPLAGIAVLVIYADIIRKAEVWVEVAAEQVAAVTGHHPSSGPGSSTQLPDKVEIVPVDVNIRHTETLCFKPAQGNGPLSTGAQPVNGLVPQRLNHAITFDLGSEEAVIDLPVRGGTVDDAVVQELLDEEEPWEEPEMILEQPADGSKPKAWKRQQLGWYGAIKLIMGYKKPRMAEDIPFGLVAYDKKQGPNTGRRQTMTF